MKNAAIAFLIALLMISGCTQQPQANAPLTASSALAIANSSGECLAAGSLTGQYTHEGGLWKFGLGPAKPGCSPSCAVYDSDKHAAFDAGCPAQPPPAPAKPAAVSVYQNGQLGLVLVDRNNMTLYVFLKDKDGKPACYGGCAALWPPLAYTPGDNLTGLPGTLGTVNRTDGIEQVTYNGMPLYLFARDKEPGEATGQGFNRLWFALSPDAASPPSPPPLTEAQARANATACLQYGNLTSAASYNDSSGSWTIGLDASRPGCSPACVVLNNLTSSVDLRCQAQNMTNQTLTPIAKPYEYAGLGQVIATDKGKALYVYINDGINSSSCTGGCAQSWPPLLLSDGYTLDGTGLSGSLGTILRPDGGRQVTYNGMPLYTYLGDTQAGIANGNGAGNVWFVATPDMATFPQPPPPPPPSYGGGGY